MAATETVAAVNRGSSNGQRAGAAFFAAADVAERFRSGGLLLDTTGYKIDAL